MAFLVCLIIILFQAHQSVAQCDMGFRSLNLTTDVQFTTLPVLDNRSVATTAIEVFNDVEVTVDDLATISASLIDAMSSFIINKLEIDAVGTERIFVILTFVGTINNQTDLDVRADGLQYLPINGALQDVVGFDITFVHNASISDDITISHIDLEACIQAAAVLTSTSTSTQAPTTTTTETSVNGAGTTQVNDTEVASEGGLGYQMEENSDTAEFNYWPFLITLIIVAAVLFVILMPGDCLNYRKSNRRVRHYSSKAETPTIKTENSIAKAENPIVKAESPAVKAENSTDKTDNSNVETDNSNVKTDNSDDKGDNSAVKTESSTVQIDKSDVKTENAPVETDNSAVKTENAPVETDNSVVKTENAPVETDNSTVKTENPPVQIDNSAVKTENSTVKTDNSAVKPESSTVQIETPTGDA